MSNQKKGPFGKGTPNNIGEEDQAFLSQIEQNIREKGNEQADARLEAELRAREMDRIRNASANIPIPGKPAAQTETGPKSATPPPTKKRNPLEDDPRYKEYFERLRRQKGEAPASQPSTPAHGTESQQASTAQGRQTVGPGSMVAFDDGSIGIYKDAVSGRDYALFYFLQPDGQFTPEGVFLQCYQARVLGQMPENYFARMRDEETWNRDLIVFHLEKFEDVEKLDSLAEHEERKPSQKTPRATPSVNARAGAHATPPGGQAAGTPSHPAQGSAPPTSESPGSAEQSQPANHDQSSEISSSEPGLVKGRRFQIKFGGKQWEAVYWTSEGENAIVAHNTHGAWSLMRLDLSRFKESLELLDTVDSKTLEAIATQAAGQ